MAARTGLLALALAVLAACDATAPRGPVPIPPPRADRPASTDTPAAPEPLTRSQTSLDLERHYGRVQVDLKRQGRLRTDRTAVDAPFASHNLASNFIRIALFDEYVTRAGALVAEQTESRLRRWESPVSFQITFGATISEDQRRRDTAAMSIYARTLAGATGHPISVTNGSNANFHVLMLHEDERRAYGPELRKLVPGISDTAVNTIESMPRETFCLVFAFSRENTTAYTNAVAVIRGEHPDLLRLSCLHEELAQGLGLANDSPDARPSIFNDDEEFALLTRHDELLLGILYDKRLRPGMDATTARPVVSVIANELMGGDS